MALLKTLILVRHGKAANFSSRLPDTDRPLTETGVIESYDMAEQFHSEKIVLDAMISSPGIRAISTALIFARTLNVSPSQLIIADELYEISTSNLMKFISGIDNKLQTVMLFGHNPAFSDLASEICNSSIHLPTAAVAGFSWTRKNWNEIDFNNGSLEMFIYPR